jgi:hypothetical protein
MVFLIGFWTLLLVWTMLSSDEDVPFETFLPVITAILVCVAVEIIFFAVFFLRIKYILKDNVLLVRRYFKTYEIYYTSIKSVEEVVDRSIFIINMTPSVASSKQIWIRFADINGKEGMVNICPVKKQEFLSMLRSKVPNPEVFTQRGIKKTEKYQSWKALTPTKKLAFIVFFAILTIVYFGIRIIL